MVTIEVAIQQPYYASHTIMLHCNFKNAIIMSNFFNNGLRTPNIFERAKAYDNWNEGNFQPQEDGYGSISDKYNSYKKVYDQLSEKEKTLSFILPISRDMTALTMRSCPTFRQLQVTV